MIFNMHLVVGHVGSGKTRMMEHIIRQFPESVAFRPGVICRSAVGDSFFSRPLGNAPPSMDGLVQGVFGLTIDLCDRLLRPHFVTDGWPRTDVQAEFFGGWVKTQRDSRDLRVYVHNLVPPLLSWERDMERYRWSKHPELEEVDRSRLSASLADSRASMVVLRSISSPLLEIHTYSDLSFLNH